MGSKVEAIKGFIDALDELWAETTAEEPVGAEAEKAAEERMSEAFVKVFEARDVAGPVMLEIAALLDESAAE